jgi:hypothetical protein
VSGANFLLGTLSAADIDTAAAAMTFIVNNGMSVLLFSTTETSVLH